LRITLRIALRIAARARFISKSGLIIGRWFNIVKGIGAGTPMAGQTASQGKLHSLAENIRAMLYSA
jgi:hypothetical protein